MTSEANALLSAISKKVDEVAEDVADLAHDIRGNGDKGLKQRVARLEGHVFSNPKTGDPGLVRRVNDHDQLINGVRAQMRLLNTLLSIFGIGGLVAFLRFMFGG